MKKPIDFKQFLVETDIQTNPAMSQEYFASLNRRAQYNVQQIARRYGNQMANFMMFVQEAQRMQRGHEKELEDLARAVILDQFGPILGNTELDIKIPQPQEIQMMMKPPKEPEEEQPASFKEIEDDETKTAIHKRKIMNMIAQGEALNAKKLFTGEVAKEGLDRIFGAEGAAKMTDLLIKITDIATAMDWTMPEEVAKQMWEQGGGFSGASKIEWKPSKKDIEGSIDDDDEEEQGDEEPQSDEATIVVRGLDFAMLIHESIKGIYSLINQGGLAHLDDEAIKKVFMNTDTMADEIQDLKRGKLTAADLRDFLNTFPEVTKMENGREYVWGKMIDAKIVPDAEFLELMQQIWTSAPLYRQVEQGEPQYSPADRARAEESMVKAKESVQKLIDLIKKELSDWEETQKPGFKSSYDEDDDVMDEPSGEPSYEPPAKTGGEETLSKRDIQELIDQALDRRDFAEVARLSNLMSKISEAKEYNDEP